MHLIPKAGLALALVSAAGVAAPALAQTQDLFLTNFSTSTISRFAGTGPGTVSTTPTTLSGGLSNPEGLAFDAKGDLFVANRSGNTVTEFVAGATPGSLGMGTVVETGLSNPIGLALDARGDLFVANQTGSTVTEFAFDPGTGTFGTASTPFATGLNNPLGLTFDARGDLFVANALGGSNNSGTITEFASTGPGTFGTASTLTAPGLNQPAGLAFDNSGDLFVANQLGNTLTEFAFTPGSNGAPGTFGSGINFATGLNGPTGPAFDARGDLFVTNYANGSNGQGSITEFAFTPGSNGSPGMFTAGKTVESGLNGPSFLAFGPVPAVPEASTTASLGLLLALGLGGVVMSARRRKASSTF